MDQFFSTFFLYSFLGFLIEVAYTRLCHHPKQDRKCLLFLPLCPVYGLGALAVLVSVARSLIHISEPTRH